MIGMANLTNLNLDHTGVSKSCLKYLKGIHYLLIIKIKNELLTKKKKKRFEKFKFSKITGY